MRRDQKIAEFFPRTSMPLDQTMRDDIGIVTDQQICHLVFQLS